MSLTIALFLCIQIWIGHQMKVCRHHKATDSTHLGPSTSSFCVVFCIWYHGIILPYSNKKAIWEVGEHNIPATLQMQTTTNWSLVHFSYKTPLERQIIKAEFEQSMESVTWSGSRQLSVPWPPFYTSVGLQALHYFKSHDHPSCKAKYSVFY